MPKKKAEISASVQHLSLKLNGKKTKLTTPSQNTKEEESPIAGSYVETRTQYPKLKNGPSWDVGNQGLEEEGEKNLPFTHTGREDTHTLRQQLGIHKP